MLSAFPRFSYLGVVLTYLRLRSAGFQHGCSPLPGRSPPVGPAPRHCPSLPSASMLPRLYGWLLLSPLQKPRPTKAVGSSSSQLPGRGPQAPWYLAGCGDTRRTSSYSLCISCSARDMAGPSRQPVKLNSMRVSPRTQRRQMFTQPAPHDIHF